MRLNPHKELLDRPLHQLSELEISLSSWEDGLVRLAASIDSGLPPAKNPWMTPLASAYASWAELAFLVEDYWRLRVVARDERDDNHEWARSIVAQYEGCVADVDEIERSLGNGFLPLLREEIEKRLTRWNFLMDHCLEQGGFSQDYDTTDKVAMKLERDNLYWLATGLTSARNVRPERFKDLDTVSLWARTEQRDVEFAKLLKGSRDGEYEGEANMWWHNPGESPDL